MDYFPSRNFLSEFSFEKLTISQLSTNDTNYIDTLKQSRDTEG